LPHALVVDDDADFLASLSELLKQHGLTVATASTIAGARAQLEEAPPGLVITDLMLPDGSGLELLRLAEGIPDCEVVLISGQATVDSAIEAVQRGALDYLTKPLDLPRLTAVLGHVSRARTLKAEIESLRDQLREFGRFGRLVGASSAMQKVYDLIARVAPTSAPVFITGESGTGKELVAQTVHELSRRSAQPFTALNCGALPPTLVESELFGHEKGSFTGASQLRRGHFERSSGGTLFLDEITEMPLDLQAKLLRVLETGTLFRVGGDELVSVDVRIVAATNRVPAQAVSDGKLREDLFYRLNVFPIAIPPLRQRDGDVMALAQFFLDELNRGEGTAKSLSAASAHRIRSHLWRGNVRELQNEIQRAFILADGAVEILADAPPQMQLPPGTGPVRAIPIGTPLAQVERELILATLEHCAGDKRQAAAMLGISLKTLYNRLNVYDGSSNREVERT
jgi:two-component system, NtrC family, response regulator AtoC